MKRRGRELFLMAHEAGWSRSKCFSVKLLVLKTRLPFSSASHPPTHSWCRIVYQLRPRMAKSAIAVDYRRQSLTELEHIA